MQKSGILIEISPLGTGFIKDATGRVFGFHHSMLVDSEESAQLLEGKPVQFEIGDSGLVESVELTDTAKA